MSKSFETTLNNTRRFTTYTLAIVTLVKSIKVLRERGADPKAVSFMLTGMDKLIKQLEDAAQKLQNKQLVEDFLNEIRKEQEE